MIFVLLAVPIIAALTLLLIKEKRLQHAVNISASVLMTLTAAFLTRQVMLFGKLQYEALGGIFYVDSLSVIVLDIVILIGLCASISSVKYMENEIAQGAISTERLRIYYILMNTFVFTMILALTVSNMGVLWIAIEATTLASAFLVGLYNNEQALEAAWKYVIICSVGIAVALLGIVFLHLSSIGLINSSSPLNWTVLYENARALDSTNLRLAFLFIFIGFGTKAGLVPMHTWLPDAHSQAPSPISAMLSGALLNIAMYGIIRTLSIVNKNLGSSDFTGKILIVAGILSMAIAAIFIFTQGDYKRLLAYSSIEHMGIIAIAMGLFTPLSVFGGLLHMVNHSLTKSMLFLSSGNILQKFQTREISKLSGVLKIMPFTGLALLLGLFAIAGTPPFSVFFSEFAIIASTFKTQVWVVGVIFILLLSFIFAGIAVNMLKIFHFNKDRTDHSIEESGIKPGEINLPGTVTILALLVLIAVTGLFVPQQLINFISEAQNIILGV